MSGGVHVGRVAAAVLLPPLGIYLERGAGRDFAIGSVLTLLAFIPGAVFALWTVLRPGRVTPA